MTRFLCFVFLISFFLFTSFSKGAPVAAQETTLKESEEKAPEKTVPPSGLERKPVHLRDTARTLTPKDVKAVLDKYGFYATCWNYNGDFCNPEGDFENDFSENHDGTLTDRATGLMWQQGGSSEPVTWQETKTYVEEVNRKAFAGYSDWRLPSVEELASLMEKSWQNNDLFIDPAFDKAQRSIWSVDTRDMDTAWKANFHMGFILHFPKTTKNFVRLVRSVRGENPRGNATEKNQKP